MPCQGKHAFHWACLQQVWFLLLAPGLGFALARVYVCISACAHALVRASCCIRTFIFISEFVFSALFILFSSCTGQDLTCMPPLTWETEMMLLNVPYVILDGC